jgi:hypothetical protein
LLATRKLVGPAPGRFGQVKPFQHFVDAAVPFEARPALRPEQQVLPQCHMRK